MHLRDAYETPGLVAPPFRLISTNIEDRRKIYIIIMSHSIDIDLSCCAADFRRILLNILRMLKRPMCYMPCAVCVVSLCLLYYYYSNQAVDIDFGIKHRLRNIPKWWRPIPICTMYCINTRLRFNLNFALYFCTKHHSLSLSLLSFAMWALSGTARASPLISIKGAICTQVCIYLWK